MSAYPMTLDELAEGLLTGLFKFNEEARTCRIMVRSWPFIFENPKDVGGWREVVIPFNAPSWARAEANRIMNRIKQTCSA